MHLKLQSLRIVHLIWQLAVWNKERLTQLLKQWMPRQFLTNLYRPRDLVALLRSKKAMSWSQQILLLLQLHQSNSVHLSISSLFRPTKSHLMIRKRKIQLQSAGILSYHQTRRLHQIHSWSLRKQAMPYSRPFWTRLKQLHLFSNQMAVSLLHPNNNHQQAPSPSRFLSNHSHSKARQSALDHLKLPQISNSRSSHLSSQMLITWGHLHRKAV